MTTTKKSKKEKKESLAESLVPDVVKKVVSIGIGAAFMTEDAVRTVLSDLPLPKNIISGLLENAQNSKKDFIESIRQEIGGYLDKLDVKNVADHLAQNYDLEIHSVIKFKEKKSDK